MKKNKLIRKIKRFLRDCKYAINQLKRPSPEEYWTMVKISGTIIMLTGLIGFVFYLIYYFLTQKPGV